jgi:hypothetical protein
MPKSNKTSIEYETELLHLISMHIRTDQHQTIFALMKKYTFNGHMRHDPQVKKRLIKEIKKLSIKAVPKDPLDNNKDNESR